MSDLFSLDGQGAVITGGGRGLGRAMALALAGAGAGCVLVARREDDLAESVELVQAAGGKAVAVPGDVLDPEVAPRAVAACIEHFGRVDILVNNAGQLGISPIEDTPDEDWQRVLDVNLVGPFRFCKAVAPHFKQQKSGKVVNIASVLGTFGVADSTAYCAAKAGIMGFTRSLAVEWGPHGVGVNALAPGLFNTDMSAGVFQTQPIYDAIVSGIPRGTHGEPEDLAGTILYLCSKASDHVTGQVIHVDGGATIA